MVEAGAVVEEPSRGAATRVAEPPAPPGGLVEEQELIAADLPQPEVEPPTLISGLDKYNDTSYV